MTLIFQRGFDQQWLSITFSKAIFLGNGLIAIISGLFGNLLVDTLAFGPVAPFDAAACFLAVGMAIILGSWGENYGDSSDNKSLLAQFKGAAVAIASGKFLILFFLDPYLILLKVKFTEYILVEFSFYIYQIAVQILQNSILNM